MSDIVIDTVRASRDGHQYHEAWVARRALALLLPQDGLCAIAVEGLSEEDSEAASAPAIEVADATFYFGGGSSLERCSRMEITQFKYSIASADRPLRFSDAKKTLVKFSKAETDFISKHGTDVVYSKLSYSLLSNRPISDDLIAAFGALASRTIPQYSGGREQYDQLCAAVPLRSDQLQRFVSRIALVGRGGALQSIERGNARTIADWSASGDVMARARLGELRQLVRDKAGSVGQHNNLITQVDVLAALEIAQESDLLPTPQAFPEPGAIVERVQIHDFIQESARANHWIVHASGGIGKTVFTQSLAARLSKQDEVVVFDCFGGGAYRSFTDARHRPERGLLHIVNELACRGLCDPILPGATDPAEVVRRSIQRFRQVIEVLRRINPAARLVIIMDAADNAAIEASRRGQPSFPRELLETLSNQAAIDGLLVIATARTEWRELASGRAVCEFFELMPFTEDEARMFITARRPDATSAQTEAIYRRSDGNPRIIANLIEPDRSLLRETQVDGKVDLSLLIQERLERAVRLTDQKGAKANSISAFLCALSVLPPPVPVDEMAVAFDITPAEVESFAADLSPLLDRTRHGIIFRDEPTETIVHKSMDRSFIC
jgi:hypothetical protein